MLPIGTLTCRMIWIAVLTLLAPWMSFAENPNSADAFILVKDGQAACKIVSIVGRKPELMMERAAGLLSDTVERWGGAAPEDIELKSSRKLPEGPAIVLSTLERLKKVCPDIESVSDPIRRTAFIDDHGFAIVSLQYKGAQRIFVVSKTSRGVCNGAQYLHDFMIEGSKAELKIPSKTVVRSPWMSGRAVYLLTIWAQECQYTVQDWAKVFDSFVRDGNDRVYFWMSGHFPSKKFPQTYKVLNRDGDKIHDRTAETRIGTVKDLRRIITEAHNRGLKLYIGGAIGGWCGTRFITNLQPGTVKTGPAIHSLCPSHPLVRRSLIEYFTEMFDALPEADGIYVESTDEDGACQCSKCSQVLDEYGSRQFGQSQLTLMQEMAASIWRRHPHARIAYTIGYAEHTKDPAYYELVRQMSTDPRFEWMEARNSRVFPGPRGQELNAAYFSPQVMHWKPYELHPPEIIVEVANQAANSGIYGLISDFSPGFDTGSFYNQIPYPTELLPYVLTGFMFREVTWDPTLTPEELRRRVKEGFFGREASDALVQDFVTLREILRSPATEKLDEIQQRVNQARPGASPKTLDSLILMHRAIEDIRKNVKLKK